MAQQKDGFVFYYNQFKNKIYNYFWYRVGFNQKLAEDLTAEAFLKALKKFEDFDGSRPFGPWIYAIAHNHLVNHYKMAGRETSLTEQANWLEAASDNLDERLELERIIKIINTMDAADKEVLLWRFAEGLSNSEIAEMLDKAEGTVRTQISRALARLRELIKE
jgi:RNA polymerase sigma-70 factor (ECF subfamily)